MPNTEQADMESGSSSAHLQDVPLSSQHIAGISLALRVPPFWRDKPRLWFITFEAATRDLKKSESQKAQMVIAQLEKEDIEQICDLLYNPPAENQYTVIKERLISVYEESDGKQLQKLLSDMELGDQKPSQLLRRMRSLAHKKVPDNTLRLMWMNLLPAHVRSVLVVSDTISKETALEELAKLADKMMEQTTEVSAVSIATASQQTHESAGIQNIVDEIKKLHLEIAELKTSCRHNRHDRSRTPPRRHYGRSSHRAHSRPRSRSSTPAPPSTHCFYHRRFVKHARHCTTPCNYNTDTKTEN
ncbi:hypothetical protein PYW08_004283 [Mythimna loreyi]|uniref:Uncharacterized protein n=1 Tax=Mythimna loreyi TaxID=667449 RepID=A0ACC2QTL2_9NEOP|nr:hypothetical protein PYW08_004283 [Mythimna loreyi]